MLGHTVLMKVTAIFMAAGIALAPAHALAVEPQGFMMSVSGGSYRAVIRDRNREPSWTYSHSQIGFDTRKLEHDDLFLSVRIGGAIAGRHMIQARYDRYVIPEGAEDSYIASVGPEYTVYLLRGAVSPFVSVSTAVTMSGGTRFRFIGSGQSVGVGVALGHLTLRIDRTTMEQASDYYDLSREITATKASIQMVFY